MKCPACGNDAQQLEVAGITVDACSACGGLWFDAWELGKVDEPHESAGEELLALRGEATVETDLDDTRGCPRCEELDLRRHFFSVKRQVEVDECPGCGGIWLDPGELVAIREQFDSEEERKAAAAQYFDELFGDDLEAMRREGGDRAESARKFARAFRFLCPSYYIPGDQDWGAH